MPYNKLSEANPAIRGIKPLVTLGQANSIARCADSVENVDSPWAVCIANFKKSHKVSGGKWVSRKEDKSMDVEELAELIESYMGSELAGKDVDLNEHLDALYGAFYKKFQTLEEVETPPRMRINKVFDDHVLAEQGTKSLKITYTINEDGTVEFGEPEEGDMVWKGKKDKSSKKGLGEEPLAIDTQVVPTLTLRAVKALEDESGRRLIEGYATLWDQEDMEGEIMTKSAIEGPNLSRYMERPSVFWRHGQDPQIGLTPIGKVISSKIDNMGLFVRVQIYKGVEAAEMAWKLIKQGVKSFSVGAVQKFVQRAGKYIRDWPLAEISVEPLSALTNATFQIVPDAGWNKALGLDNAQEENNMPEVNVQELVTQVVEALDTRALAREKAAEEQATRDADIATKAVEKYQERLRAAGPVEVKSIFGDDMEITRRPLIVSDVYSDASLSDLALSYIFLKAAGKGMPSEYLQKAISVKANKALDAGELATKSLVSQKGLELNNRMALAIKADELMISTGATYGDEWVYTVWSRDLWRRVRAETRLLSYIREVEVEGESLTIPIESTDPTIYKVGEATDLDNLQFSASGVVGNYDSRGATSNTTLTPSKIGGLVIWTGELNERSIVAMSSLMQDQFLLGFKEKTEELIISGHTETGATNISDYANGAISAYWRNLTLNGLRYYFIVANSGNNSRDGATLTAEDFPATRKLMGTNGKLGLRPERLKLVMDAGMYYKLLTLGEVLTQDKWQRAATIVDGVLERIFGSEVIPSGEYGATDASGYVHNTPGNNTLGSFFYFDPRGFLIGRGRNMNAEVHRVPWADAYYLVGFASLDMINFDNELIAGSYNLTV